MSINILFSHFCVARFSDHNLGNRSGKNFISMRSVTKNCVSKKVFKSYIKSFLNWWWRYKDLKVGQINIQDHVYKCASFSCLQFIGMP